MADVERGDRGQLFLVGALSLAVLFVALALLMNTAIYTENIATRGTGAGTGEAIRYGQTVEMGAAGLIRYVNVHNDATYVTLHDNLTAGVRAMSDATSVHHVYEGVAASVSLSDVMNGTRTVHDNETRAFRDGSGAANWTLASGVSGTRAFRMNVTRDELEPITEDDDVLDLVKGFQVSVDDETSTWTAYIYKNGTANAVSVKVKNGSGVLGNGVCTGPTGPAGKDVVVDLTRGTVGGEPCPLLDFGKGVSAPYDISFENGDEAAGTYSLVVDNLVSVTQLNGAYDDGDGSPYVTPAIYSATLEVTYEGPRITYRTEITVTPEGGR